MEILKNELKAVLSHFPDSNRPHFDEYSLISWDTKATHAYHFSDHEHSDITIRNDGKSSYKADLDKKNLKKAMKDICCNVCNTINQPTDITFAIMKL